MRPKILDKLFKPIETTKGIGPRLKIKLKYLIGENIVDYLWHLPNNIIDRSYKPTVVSAENDRIVTIIIEAETIYSGLANNLDESQIDIDKKG